jgi:replicative DNA helicase Mcm
MDENDRSTMHEALEQQSVTISKATVQATLRSETSVLAAANPKFGRFDTSQMIAKQVNLAPSLLNRFDCIFILKDLPDRTRDESIASHVLHEHRQDVKQDIIERELLRKYISYARQKFNPVLTTEAVDEIKKFYVNLRNQPTFSDAPVKPIPISARQLEALIRLAEAHSRIRLSKKVSKKDAQVAIDLMKYYLMQVGYDYETKTFDIDKIATGISTSQRSKIILVREALVRLEGRLGKLIPKEEVKKELEGKISEEEIAEAIQKLTQSGDIFSPRKGYVQRI